MWLSKCANNCRDIHVCVLCDCVCEFRFLALDSCYMMLCFWYLLFLIAAVVLMLRTFAVHELRYVLFFPFLWYFVALRVCGSICGHICVAWCVWWILRPCFWLVTFDIWISDFVLFSIVLISGFAVDDKCILCFVSGAEAVSRVSSCTRGSLRPRWVFGFTGFCFLLLRFCAISLSDCSLFLVVTVERSLLVCGFRLWAG